MNCLKKLIILPALLASAGGGANIMMAGSQTFAQFSEINGGNDFTFTNEADGTGIFTASSQVYFSFFSSNIPAADLTMVLPTGQITATLTRTGTVNVAATCGGACVTGAAVSESLANSILTITDNANGKILLESSGAGASLTGQIGGSVLNLQNSSPPNTLIFTSDYLNFTGGGATGRSVSFSSVEPGVSIGADGLLSSFSAAGTGTFSATFTPEPGSIGMACLGFAALALLTARRRSQKV